MFKRLLSYFNKKNNKYIDYKITEKDLHNKIFKISELYSSLGILKTLEERNLKPFHYKNLRINSETDQCFHDIINNNIKCSKHRKKNKKLKSIEFGWDYLLWGPFVDNTIPKNTIRILLPNHKQYTIVEEENKNG